MILTAAFTVLSNYAFNENSQFCIIPEKYKKLIKTLDTDNDGKVSQKEIEQAIATLNKIKDR
jgi:Ca2+-binding EF-hand superfamily protein